MNILRILKSEHQKVKKLFSQLEKTSNQDEEKRKELFGEIYHDLEQHIQAEEEAFYSELRRAQVPSLKLKESIEEHNQVKTLLNQLNSIPFNSETWLAKIIVLREDIDHHVQEEEDELFTLAKESFNTERLKKMGDHFQKLKTQAQKLSKQAS